MDAAAAVAATDPPPAALASSTTAAPVQHVDSMSTPSPRPGLQTAVGGYDILLTVVPNDAAADVADEVTTFVHDYTAKSLALGRRLVVVSVPYHGADELLPYDAGTDVLDALRPADVEPPEAGRAFRACVVRLEACLREVRSVCFDSDDSIRLVAMLLTPPPAWPQTCCSCHGHAESLLAFTTKIRTELERLHVPGVSDCPLVLCNSWRVAPTRNPLDLAFAMIERDVAQAAPRQPVVCTARFEPQLHGMPAILAFTEAVTRVSDGDEGVARATASVVSSLSQKKRCIPTIRMFSPDVVITVDGTDPCVRYVLIRQRPRDGGLPHVVTGLLPGPQGHKKLLPTSQASPPPGTPYMLSVAFLDHVGRGPFSEEVEVVTRQKHES
jgi:hypothetical protein